MKLIGNELDSRLNTRFLMHVGIDELKTLQAVLKSARTYTPRVPATTQLTNRLGNMLQCVEKALQAWQTDIPEWPGPPPPTPPEVAEAQRLRVCRICKIDNTPRPGNLFVLNYGQEYAHQQCLNRLNPTHKG